MSRKRIGKNVAYDTEKKLYYAYFDGGRGKNGRRERWTRTFRSEREAVQAVETFAAERREGGLPAAEAITVGAWLDYWLEEIVRPNLEYTTYYCYANIIRNHLKPSLGRVLLRELTPLRIQQYYTQMIKGKGLSPNTVHKHHILLHTALKLAFRQEILGSNPVDRVEPPRSKLYEADFYTPEELKRLYALLPGHRLELPVKLAGSLGLRREELCGLKWENVNFQLRVIYIREARTAFGATIIQKETKNRASVRTLYLPEDIFRLLNQERARQNALFRGREEPGHVVLDHKELPYSPNALSLAFTRFVRKNDLPRVTLHGLRHSFATIASFQGVSLFDIGKALGHSTPATTGRIYTHLIDRTHEETLMRVSDALK